MSCCRDRRKVFTPADWADRPQTPEPTNCGRPNPGVPEDLANRQHCRLRFSGEDIAIIRPEEFAGCRNGAALVIAQNGKPIVAGCPAASTGKAGARLLTGQAGLRQLADRPAWLRLDVAESPPIRDLPVSPSGASRLVVQPFPAPGQLVALAYREFDLAAIGTPG